MLTVELGSHTGDPGGIWLSWWEPKHVLAPAETMVELRDLRPSPNSPPMELPLPGASACVLEDGMVGLRLSLSLSLSPQRALGFS